MLNESRSTDDVETCSCRASDTIKAEGEATLGIGYRLTEWRTSHLHETVALKRLAQLQTPGMMPIGGMNG